MKKITVSLPGHSYDILIKRGILNSCGEYIKSAAPAKRAAIVSDSNVAPLYMATVQESLESAGIDAVSYVFPAGEESKTTETVVKIVEFLAENELTRSDLVVALGGGVAGDMAGFAAAVYLRGIRCVQLPTTLLAQVDSSVGGKTGVNLPQGKNLCGAFHQPSLVIIDSNVLNTLPEHYFKDGMGEVIKYGCIKSEALFEKIENGAAREFIEDIIYECVDIKRGVVERDEKESGERQLLNFGHTAGHSIEKLHNFSGISHGEAVGIGMVIIAAAGEKQGLTASGSAERIKLALQKYGLKTQDENSLDKIAANMKNDKKRKANSINFVMLSSIGSSFIKEVELDKAPAFLKGENIE
ncbi:MAG: 3-dehydroquinate synthase [Clostridiales bacterium]|nr:3-dehydroquinate synthase [Clostridiales bacterium]